MVIKVGRTASRRAQRFAGRALLPRDQTAEVGDEDGGMGDASQLLQGVRDREAARRRERERRAEQRRPAPVEKDW